MEEEKMNEEWLFAGTVTAMMLLGVVEAHWLQTVMSLHVTYKRNQTKRFRSESQLEQ